MEVQEQEVEKLQKKVDRCLQSIEKGKTPSSLEQVVSLLKHPDSEKDLAYRIWKYADKKQVPNHFRDFNYEDHNDLVESLEEIDETKLERYQKHELQAVKRTIDEIYETFQ